MKMTPLDDLRKPHPEQKRIDAEAAALLRATAWQIEGVKREPESTPPGNERREASPTAPPPIKPLTSTT